MYNDPIDSSSAESSLAYSDDSDLDSLDIISLALSNESEQSALSGELVLEELREILVSPEKVQIELLRSELATLRTQSDEGQLLESMAPLVTRVIERQIRESPQDVIEILYPLLGGMITRAVKEAIRNLVDRIDAQRQKAFRIQRLFSRFRARSNGVSGSAVDLRDALPFAVEELFVIHRETGLLIHHELRNAKDSYDSDVISAMLTAMGHFIQDTFGKLAQGDLKEIEYGEKRILLEDFRYVYVAAVVDGIEPFDYRHEIRSRISRFERENREQLINYAGDPSQLFINFESLRKLLLAN